MHLCDCFVLFKHFSVRRTPSKFGNFISCIRFLPTLIHIEALYNYCDGQHQQQMENNNENLEVTSDMKEIKSNNTRSFSSTSSTTHIGDYNNIDRIPTATTNEACPNPEQQDGHRSARLNRIPALQNWRRTLIFIGLYFGLLLALLDTSIIATAVYTISLDFNSLASTFWAILAYQLACLGFAVVFARVSGFYWSWIRCHTRFYVLRQLFVGLRLVSEYQSTHPLSYFSRYWWRGTIRPRTRRAHRSEYREIIRILNLFYRCRCRDCRRVGAHYWWSVDRVRDMHR